jgi:hypothetical protein
MRTRALAVLGIGFVCALGAGTPALGDGGPGPGIVQGWDGITNGKERLVAVPTVGWTSVQAIQRNGGRVIRWVNIKGSWGIPLVAFDGTSDALRPDGRTLLIATQASRTPSGKTSFALIDMKKMRVLRMVSIRGAFAFDALSPDLRYLYLIQYVSDVDFTQYRVRAYDLRANKLTRKVVSDRRSWETTMQGSPVSRLSRDGWAYTLYGGVKRPFIHALDTRRAEAVCIFMPWKSSPKRLYEYRLRSDAEGRLVVRGPRGRPLAVVDRTSHRVVSFVLKP